MIEDNLNDALQPMLSAEMFARYLAIGRRTFQTWRAAGRLPPPDLRLGRVIRWKRSTVEAWIERQSAAAKV